MGFGPANVIPDLLSPTRKLSQRLAVPPLTVGGHLEPELKGFPSESTKRNRGKIWER